MSHPFGLKLDAYPCEICGADVGQPCSADCPTWQEPADEDADLEAQERTLDLERDDPSEDIDPVDWFYGRAEFHFESGVNHPLHDER